MLTPCSTLDKDLAPPCNKARTIPMEHLDVSSFKLVRVAAVNDDDPLHQGAEVARESRHHLGNKRHFFVLTPFPFQFHPFGKAEPCRQQVGGAYHVPSDVLEVLVFATDCGQDLEDH